MKKCQKCKEEKPAECFYRRSKSPDGLQDRCKACQHKDSAARAKKNPQKHAEAVRKWQDKNPGKLRDATLRWWRKNKDRWNAYVRECQTRGREELRDSYVRGLIAAAVGCKRMYVPQSLVDAKRSVLSVQRLINDQGERS